MNRPKLIVLTGQPGSGKSTLAELLVQETPFPLVSRDQLKESYVATRGGHHDAMEGNPNKEVYRIFFQNIELLLKNNVSLIAEAAFQHGLWAPKLLELSEIADIKIVVCEVPVDLAVTRFKDRADKNPDRTRYHGEQAPAFDTGNEYKAPSLEFPTTKVNCTEGYSPSVSEIVRFILGY